MRNQLFDQVFEKGQSLSTGLESLLDEIKGLGQNLTPNAQVTGLMISAEGFNESGVSQMRQTATNLGTIVDAIIAKKCFGAEAQHVGDSNYLQLNKNAIASSREAGRRAALAVGMLAADPRVADGRTLRTPSTESFSQVMVTPLGSNVDQAKGRVMSNEMYQNVDPRAVQQHSMLYNYAAVERDDGSELFFQPLAVNPLETGYAISLPVYVVFDSAYRDIDGKQTGFKRKNIVRAFADAGILKKKQTKIVPVWRASSAANFAPNMAHGVVNTDRGPVDTAPLRFDATFDLAGINQTATELTQGHANETEQIDTSNRLEAIYLKFGTQFVKFSTIQFSMANFVPPQQGNSPDMVLTFETRDMVINSKTKDIAGNPITDLADVYSDDLMVRLHVTIDGRLNIETGRTIVKTGTVEVHEIRDANNLVVSTASGPGADVVTAVAAIDFEGYDLDSYLTNANRAKIGQLVDTMTFGQIVPVPLRDMITARRPAHAGAENDQADVKGLTTLTNIRLHNEFVNAMIDSANQLRNSYDPRALNSDDLGPDIVSPSRFYVKPYFAEEEVDMLQLDSLSHVERENDVRAKLVNAIRSQVVQAYRLSEYKAGSDVYHGVSAPLPTVVVLTDPLTENYLNVQGDLRTLGGNFKLQIATSLDARVRDKIFISFRENDSLIKPGVPSILSFGTFAWSPELVLSAVISRDGRVSHETCIQPRYLYQRNLDILIVLTVKNLRQSTVDKTFVKTFETNTAMQPTP